MTMKQGVLAVVWLGLLAVGAHARVHHLTIDKDSRRVFSIESCGLYKGGTVDLDITNFKVVGKAGGPAPKAGFLLFRSHTESSVATTVREVLDEDMKDKCFLDTNEGWDKPVIMEDGPAAKKHVTFDVTEDGLYDVLFIRCEPATAKVSFKMDLKFYNKGPDYLCAGDMPLPTLYAIMASLFWGCTVAWVIWLRRNSGKVHHVHHLMTVVVLAKALALTAEAITYHVVRARGHPIGWNVVYYIFAFVKGVMMFVVLLLIGTGWSRLRPYLLDKEKKIVLVVLCLQIIDNIAFIVIHEMAPGSVAFQDWEIVLTVVDFVCCALIIAPIVWSIRHIRQSASADGKAAEAVKRLTQFQWLYTSVVVYIYVTRIVVVLMRQSLPFNLTWLGVLFAETAALLFYVGIGYKFRPSVAEEYLRVPDSDAEDEEFGLDEGHTGHEVEMTRKPTPARSDDSGDEAVV